MIVQRMKIASPSMGSITNKRGEGGGEDWTRNSYDRGTDNQPEEREEDGNASVGSIMRGSTQ